MVVKVRNCAQKMLEAIGWFKDLEGKWEECLGI